MDARDALDLAFGRETLVETFVPELARLLRPRREFLAPAFDAALGWLGILRRQDRRRRASWL